MLERKTYTFTIYFSFVRSQNSTISSVEKNSKRNLSRKKIRRIVLSVKRTRRFFLARGIRKEREGILVRFFFKSKALNLFTRGNLFKYLYKTFCPSPPRDWLKELSLLSPSLVDTCFLIPKEGGAAMHIESAPRGRERGSSSYPLKGYTV